MAIDLQLVYLPDSHDNTLKCQQVMKSSYIHHTTERWHHLRRIYLSEHIYMYIYNSECTVINQHSELVLHFTNHSSYVHFY